MPFCNNCGNKIDIEDRFCPICGKPNKALTNKNSSSGTLVSSRGGYGDSPAGGTIDNRETGGYGVVTNLADFEKGQILNDHYRIEKFIDSGTYGYVYQVYDLHMKEVRALKFFDSQIFNADTMYDDIKKMNLFEDYRFIVRNYDPYFGSDYNFFAMEFIEGVSLSVLIRKHFSLLNDDVVLHIVKQIVSGMIEIHKHKIIHLDLKPDNILIKITSGIDIVSAVKNRKITAKITDFGVSRQLQTTKTHLGKIDNEIGTYCYMSPEQLDGFKIGYRSDIWAFGLILYEMLTGEKIGANNSNKKDMEYTFHKFLKIKEDDNFNYIQNRDIEIENRNQVLNELLKNCLKWNRDERFMDFEEIEMMKNLSTR